MGREQQESRENLGVKEERASVGVLMVIRESPQATLMSPRTVAFIFISSRRSRRSNCAYLSPPPDGQGENKEHGKWVGHHHHHPRSFNETLTTIISCANTFMQIVKRKMSVDKELLFYTRGPLPLPPPPGITIIIGRNYVLGHNLIIIIIINLTRPSGG